jgi:hypothetical protein
MGRKVEVGISWAEVSAVACQYQLQAGGHVLVATSVTAPSSSDNDAIYVKQGDINYFEPVGDKKLWAKAYYSNTTFGRIVVDEV